MQQAKERHSQRVREALSTKNSKNLWDAVREITYLKSKKSPLCVLNEKEKANDLNTFYSRFDIQDPSHPFDMAHFTCDPQHSRPLILPEAVMRAFKSLNSRKACGPDGLSGQLLKVLAEELAPAWTPLFQLSVDSGVIPSSWKKAVIVPVPKKPCPKENNDFRPVALTS